MNFALEELRQVDWLVIKNKIVPFPLFSCSLLFRSHGSRQNFLFQHSISQTSEFRFCSFQSPWHTVELIFSASALDIHQNLLLFFRFFLISKMDFEKPHPTFPRQTLLFRKLMFSASGLYFFQQKLASQYSVSALSETNLFSATRLRRRL